MVSPVLPASGATGLPQLLADERDERMREAQRCLQLAHEDRARAARGGVVAFGVGGSELHLGELDVPVAELVPHELVQRTRREVEAVGVEVRRRCRASPVADVRGASDRRMDSVLGSDSSSPQSLPSTFISTNRVAFHSLLQKLR